jgi:hypothetical protein
VSQEDEAELVFETTADALQEKNKLRRHLRRFDTFFYLICTVVMLDTIGSVASNGAQGFLGSRTRQKEITVPITVADAPADDASAAPALASDAGAAPASAGGANPAP